MELWAITYYGDKTMISYLKLCIYLYMYIVYINYLHSVFSP